jgi:predicted KAP-like P-loop ATPase
MWNDKETNVDLLGHRRIAQTIVEIIREAELRPITIGIQGSWGAGKTSILSLIEAELTDDPETLCLTFNGWLYQGYEDTKSALMESVVHALLNKRGVGAKALEMGKSLFKRINWLKAAKTAGGLALTTAVGLPPAALWGLSGLATSAKGLVGDKLDSDEDPWLKPEEATVPAQIQAFRNELQALIKESSVERLVVLVDDLDRCLPGAVIDILEAVKLFLFVEGSVFIIAADEQMIEYAVRRHFPDLPVSQADYTKHYLEKLIQIPIRVPSLNSLQTQNYIRFLLLQNHLQNDKARLNEICIAFEGGRDTPYDNKELTYAFITEQLGDSNQDLRKVLNVGEQLGATLAKELRGNPRNIKRFLNKLFLRMRIAKIYGLENKVQLDALAKMMLLETFHGDKYEQVVADVTSSPKGTSTTIQQLEQPAADLEQPEAKEKTTKTKAGRAEEPTHREASGGEEPPKDDLQQWASFAPTLAEMDLRPYVFISRERVVSFHTAEEIPLALMPLYTTLLAGNRMAMVSREADAKALSAAHAQLLFEQLRKESVTIQDWQSVPKPVEGVLYLVQQQPALEAQLVKMISSVVAKDLGVWVGSKLNGFSTGEGQAARASFFAKLQQDPQTKQTLKNLLNQK